VAITIPAGTPVTWKNNDDVPHDVTSDDNKMFKSKALDTMIVSRLRSQAAVPTTTTVRFTEDASQDRGVVTRGVRHESV
jgi:plastocyanin